MAEILLYIGQRSDTPGDYADGDCLCASNDRRIRQCHAEMICHPKFAEKVGNCRSRTSLAGRFFDAIYRFHCVRVSTHEVMEYETDLLGNVLSSRLRDDFAVDEFFLRRKRHNRHRVFGSDGAEVYHYGVIDVSQAAIDQAWTLIQTHSAHLYLTDASCPYCGDDHNLWCLGAEEVKQFLPIRTVDFTDAEAAGLVGPHMDGANQIARRGVKCFWRELLPDLGLSESEVLDKTIPVGRLQVLPEVRWTVKLHVPASNRSHLYSKNQGARLG